jgi:hypothetical protein
MPPNPAKAKPTPVFGAIAQDGENIVALPISQLQDSLGRQLYFQHQQPTIPLLCRQSHDAAECKNLHPTAAYLQLLEAQPDKGTRPCCAYCGDPFSRALLDEEGDPRLQLLGPVFFEGVMYPMERLMITTAIVSISPMEVLAPNRVCKDHLMDYCPRSKDCSLIHLCRKRAEACEAPYFTKPPAYFGHPTPAVSEVQDPSVPPTDGDGVAPLIDLQVTE